MVSLSIDMERSTYGHRTHCNALQHTAIHCNTLHYNIWKAEYIWKEIPYARASLPYLFSIPMVSLSISISAFHTCSGAARAAQYRWEKIYKRSLFIAKIDKSFVERDL